jgi:signal transduction histidine kinase
MEVEICRSQAPNAVLRIKLTAIMDAEESVSGVMVIGTDITEMRSLEDQIVHAERLATLGKLSAGIVHEINNPLTSISAYSNLLLRRKVGDESDQERLQRIAQAADRILHFTRGLVAYARPNRERPERLDLNKTIDESIAFCEHIIHEKKVSIQRQYAPDLPAIDGVKTNLHQVFINLLTNGCQAATGQGAQITISTSCGKDGTIVAALRDNGPGIAPEQIEQIFDPFFSTKPEGEGTGLGLPIAKSIVEQHSGSIGVETVLGTGATFSVCLPISAAAKN